jgi:predicted O-methyltransferase YrrM
MRLEWRDVDVDGGPPINTSLTGVEAAWLVKAAAGQAHVLEVGSAYGYSTVLLAGAADHVDAVDPHVDLGSVEVLRGNLAARNLTRRVTILEGFSQVLLPQLRAQGLRYGVVFVDGDHTQAAVEHDAVWGLRLLQPGGLLCCHDYDEATCPGVRAGLDRLLGRPPTLVDTLAVYPR